MCHSENENDPENDIPDRFGYSEYISAGVSALFTEVREAQMLRRLVFDLVLQRDKDQNGQCRNVRQHLEN